MVRIGEVNPRLPVRWTIVIDEEIRIAAKKYCRARHFNLNRWIELAVLDRLHDQKFVDDAAYSELKDRILV